MLKAKADHTAGRKATTHCAIYTRKSHDEGLDQEFNSLDAQREACEAYIKSQKNEGWVCMPEMYDDGGISGATLERPALKRLLSSIESGQVDSVVVYKVDRLTRSLGDFAKIVEVFDKRDVSFVSVTQQFNTTSSMGRLTLNMLLSFAQFEREVTGERIRDKIAASKKKGMWMGGLPPLGYDVLERKLVINSAEAETVRNIYHRYKTLGSVRALKDALDGEGIVSKVRIDRFGRTTGGKPIARGALYLMLQNRIYLGEIVHKENSYPGEHNAIIDQALWDEVQHKLAVNRVNRATGANAEQPSLLAGFLYDDAGHRMTPSHANKKGTRYRYYASQNLVRRGKHHAPRGRRVPARDLEALVEERLVRFLSNESDLFGAIESHMANVSECTDFVGRAAKLCQRWPIIKPAEKRVILTASISRIDVLSEKIEIHVLPGRLPALLRDEENHRDWSQSNNGHEPTIKLSIPARLKRTGLENRILIDGAGGGSHRQPDHSLHRVLAQAQQYQEMVMCNGSKSMTELAAEAGVTGSYFTRILRLSFLAPSIVTSILRDQHPIELTAKRLVSQIRLPITWDQQRTLLSVG